MARDRHSGLVEDRPAVLAGTQPDDIVEAGVAGRPTVAGVGEFAGPQAWANYSTRCWRLAPT